MFYLVHFTDQPDANLSVLEALHDFMHEHCKRNANIILCGDFNLPKINWNLLSVSSSCQHSELLLDIAFSLCLKQLVDRFTQVTATSSTLLDLSFFVSDKIRDLNYEMSYFPGMSDHNIVLFTGHMWVLQAESEKVLKSFMTLIELKMRVCWTSWNKTDIFEHRHAARNLTVDDLWIHFRAAVNECISKYVPTRQKKRETVRILGSHVDNTIEMQCQTPITLCCEQRCSFTTAAAQ